MRSNLDDVDPERLECGNCGEKDDLLRCSRCRTAWYCCHACQKSHWPFHRAHCRSNAFADAVETTEPKFARWLRAHGKQATLRDGDVERLERASMAACAPVSRVELMDSLWGKADPSPEGPRWGVEGEEKMAVAAAEEILMKEKGRGRGRAATAATLAFGSEDALPPPIENEGKRHCLFGRDNSPLWRWWQTPTRVEVVVNLFEVRRELRRATTGARVPLVRRRLVSKNERKSSVNVSIGPQSLSVSLPGFSGSDEGEEDEKEKKSSSLFSTTKLFRRVAVGGSTWHVSDNVLFISLLKLSRRGCYAAGETAAETWWRGLFEKLEGEEESVVDATSPRRLFPLFLEQLPLPSSAPLEYYSLPRDPDDEPAILSIEPRKRK